MEQVEKRNVDDIIQAEAGSLLHRAIVACEAQGSCEAAYEEFRYDKDFPADLLEAMKVVAESQIEL